MEASQIDKYLYLGNWISAQNARPETIKAVLSVINVQIPPEMKINGIDYYALYAEDDEDWDLLTYFPQTNQLIGEWVESERPILVHCALGMSRSAAVVCAYIMRKYDKCVEEAIDWVRQRRPIIDPNQGFVNQLRLYHQMGFALDAKNRRFRNFLMLSYLRISGQMYSLSLYFSRLVIAASLTPRMNSGPEYSCVWCGTPAFNAINIVRNEGSNEGQYCRHIYIEPRIWMAKQIEEPPVLFTKESKIKCSNCTNILATFQPNLIPYKLECDCLVHKGLDKLAMIKVVADSVQVLE